MISAVVIFFPSLLLASYKVQVTATFLCSELSLAHSTVTLVAVFGLMFLFLGPYALHDR